MRPVIRPSAIAFASGHRLASVDGNGIPSLGTRLTALADLLPFVSGRTAVKGYHATDLIVTSHNPLLAALALRAAALAGRSAAVTLNYGDDMWPYDLAVTDEIGHVLAAALGIEVPASTEGSVVPRLLERILSEIPASYPVITHAIFPGSRHPEQEGTFFLGEEIGEYTPANPHHERMSQVFRRFMARRPALSASGCGRIVVFSRHLLLTGRPESFGTSTTENGLIRWRGPVSGFGSARWDLPTYPDAAKAMLEDVITLARGLPPAIAAAILKAGN